MAKRDRMFRSVPVDSGAGPLRVRARNSLRQNVTARADLLKASRAMREASAGERLERSERRDHSAGLAGAAAAGAEDCPGTGVVATGVFARGG